MAEFDTKLIRQSRIKPIKWKRYIDDVFSLWNRSKQDINLFIEQANQFHPSIKFTAEISENEITFLDTIIYKGDRFLTDSILDIKTQYKPTETFQYTHFTSCHPPGVTRAFIKGEANGTPQKKTLHKLLLKSPSQSSHYASKHEDILITSLRGL